ncbi:MAG: hypothetical protein JRI91_00865 [Deltaproteobacteria bacterium]|nr:hypothetical protein [Deltaproteobacteria bacterium]
MTIAITGINSYIAPPLLKKLEEDQDVEKIIGIDVTPWKVRAMRKSMPE